MNNMMQRTERSRGWCTRVASGILVGLSVVGLTACSDLLDVELPSSITADALDDPATARAQVLSAVAHFECAWGDLTYEALGYEDAVEKISGFGAADPDYPTSVSAQGCDPRDEVGSWYGYTQRGRQMAETAYDKITNQWNPEDVPNRTELLALSALYSAASQEILGTYLCEGAIDAGPLMTPSDMLIRAEVWADIAIGHIAEVGDFEIDNEISSSAELTAYGIRGRMRWHRGDEAAALPDLERIPMGFEAVVTRDPGVTRRNKVHLGSFNVPYLTYYPDVNDWWMPLEDDPINPVTSALWPLPIPFTGYVGLGILPDGRVVRGDGIPIRTEIDGVVVDAGAIEDPRIPAFQAIPVGSREVRWIPAKYTSTDEDIPWLSWREVWLIRADIEGGQTAIDLVNDIRTFHGLPLVTYADPADATEIRYMVTEEVRRELHAEGGRYWAYKLLNTDLLWFPRGIGVEPENSWPLEGGVRVLMPGNEYDLNENFTDDDRATGCPLGQQPFRFN